MLVVGRIYVDEVDVEGRRELVRVEARDGARRARDGFGQPQVEVVEGAGRPRLEIRHLQAGRTVHAVGGEQERRQEEGTLDGRQSVALDRLADRLDPGSVLRLEVARPAAERLCEPTVATLEGGELLENRLETRAIDLRAGLDVGASESLGVGREVVRVHHEAEAPERLPHPRRAGEEIACRTGGQPGGDARDQRHERPLRPDVLDQGFEPNRCRRWCLYTGRATFGLQL